MKRLIFILLLVVIIVSSCNKEELKDGQVCVEVAENPVWTSEDFKANYTVQFPGNYEGSGMVGFEGNFFSKSRIDGKVSLSYNYCSPLYCPDYGEVLQTPIPNSITANDKENNSVILSNKKEFCLNKNIRGILFFNTIHTSTAKYYMFQNSEFYEALSIYFDKSAYQEVEDIIKTISEK